MFSDGTGGVTRWLSFLFIQSQRVGGDDSVFHIEGNHIVIDISDISYYPVAKGIRLEREVYRKL